uniref:Uncharacterized protein n=1 Tax=Romanomermis culicivorax TaxID=13658 RepID=A0A915J174_ROMCU
MIQGYDRIIQALLGGLFTWSVTALGAGLVFVFKSENKKLLVKIVEKCKFTYKFAFFRWIERFKVWQLVINNANYGLVSAIKLIFG